MYSHLIVHEERCSDLLGNNQNNELKRRRVEGETGGGRNRRKEGETGGGGEQEKGGRGGGRVKGETGGGRGRGGWHYLHTIVDIAWQLHTC